MSEPPKSAFVLSGSPSLGAIQVGMLRALYERGIAADLIVGTSVGAVNRAFIAFAPRKRPARPTSLPRSGAESAAAKSSSSTH